MKKAVWKMENLNVRVRALEGNVACVVIQSTMSQEIERQ